MPITRISECKGITFLLFYKELRELFVSAQVVRFHFP